MEYPMRRFINCALGTTSLVLAACSSPTLVALAEPPTTHADFRRDSQECHSMQDFLDGSRGTVTLHMHAYAHCMKADGWIAGRRKQPDDQSG
jgi:hypothetical protein